MIILCRIKIILPTPNIYLENDEQFPVIMGGWSYKSSNDSDDLTFIEDPLIITYY